MINQIERTTLRLPAPLEVYSLRAASGRAVLRTATVIRQSHLGRGRWQLKVYDFNEDGTDRVETLPSLKACKARAAFLWGASVITEKV